ncbi:MAG: thrombospondin type 3 repeat-containing protein, partial [Myxococcota bacterium]|nr:thrombospondin type 3 repeat-containing protein [Myxococcota bacterium]
MRPRLPRILPIRTSSSARHLLLCLALLGASVAAGAGGACAQSAIVTYPAPLNTNSDTDSLPDSNVQIAWGENSGAGTFLAVWESDENLGGTAGTDTDIFFSTGDGIPGNWSPPALLNTNGTSDSGGDNNVQVASDGAGHWVAVWQGHENLNGTTGTEGDILVATSADDGYTWTATALLNNNGDSDGVGDIDSHPTIASDGAGNWIAAWQSFTNLNGTTGPDLDILTATSSDNGLTWSDPALLNSSGASDSGANARDKNPHLASNGEGEWVAVWDSQTNLNGAGNDYDIFFALSSDAGASWTSAALLNSNGTTDSGIDPLSGSDTYPQVIWDGMHSWVAVWQSNEDLAGPGGSAGTDDDIFVSLMRRNTGGWSAPTVLDSNAEIDTGGDFSPRIHADGAGHWVTVWHSSEDRNPAGLGEYLLPGDVFVPTGFYEGSAGTDTDIFIASATSPSYSATGPTPCEGGPCVTTDVVLLNVNGTEDAVPSASDSYASIATDGSGNWVAAWSSTGNLGGTAGTDGDILFAWSNDLDGDYLPADDGGLFLGYDNCPFEGGVGEIGFEPDTDEDGLGDICDPFPSDPLNDIDGDGYSGPSDNCPLTANPNQTDSNTDGVGDRCESPDFSFPALLNTNGTTEFEYDAAPKIVTDGSGLWLAAWESRNSIAEAPMGDTSGTDSDIFFARSTDAGTTWTDPGLLNTNATFDAETSNDGEV